MNSTCCYSLFFSQLAKHLIVLFNDRVSLTQKGKQHGQHKHYYGHTLRTIDRRNRTRSVQAFAPSLVTMPFSSKTSL